MIKDSLKSLAGALEQCFGFTSEAVQLTGGLSHSVYLLDQEKIIVKVYSKEISYERLQSEAKVLDFLSKCDSVVAPKLIRSITGEFRVPFNSTYLSCFKKIEGRAKYLLTECPGAKEGIKDIGKYLGRLHKEMSFNLLKAAAPQTSPILELSKGLPGVKTAEVEQILASLFRSKAPYFTTHGDYQQSNLLYENDKISGVVDFEYSAMDFRVNDIAGCLSNLLSANAGMKSQENIIADFIAGYQETSENILPAEIDVLTGLIKLIWHVNLYWVEMNLREVQTDEIRSLLELYRAQTQSCVEF